MASKRVKNGAKKLTNSVKNVMKRVNFINTEAAKTPFLRAFTKPGKNACVNAPSPNKRRNKFGSLNATKKISLQSEAPRALAVNKSRIKPKIRENKIPKLFVKKCFIIKSR